MKKRMLFHVILLLTLTWGGFSGCGGDEIVSPTETEVVEVTEVTEVTDLYDGDIIYFKQAGIIYEGRVVKGVSATEVLVRLADSSEMVIGVAHIGGKRIAAHPDVGVRVVLLGDRNKNEKLLNGEIVAVFGDGMRKIEIFAVKFMDGTSVVLDVPHIRLVHKDTDYGDRGYMTLEEFFRIENGLD